MYKIGFLIAILLIAPIILVQDVLSSDGYWAPDNVTWNIVNARDDVSTTWKNVSNMSVAGSTIWKWDTMDCTQKIVSNFSWRGIPEIMEQSKPYNLTAKLEQIECNENCLSVGSSLALYIALEASPEADGPKIYFGTGSGLVEEQTSEFWGPIHYPGYNRSYIRASCGMYQELYDVIYWYKWVEGNAPLETQKLV